MGDRRPSRFRLPWFISPSSRPTPPRPLPSATIQRNSAVIPRPSTNIDDTRPFVQPATTTNSTSTAQKPPFRPPGVAPAQAAPQTQESRTDSRSSSPAQVSKQSRATSEPASPSRGTTQSEAPSKISALSNAGPNLPTESILTSSEHTDSSSSLLQPTSGPHEASHSASGPGEQKSCPPSPSVTAMPAQPSTDAVDTATYSHERSRQRIQKASQSPPSSAKTSRLIAKKELKKETSQPHDLHIKREIASNTASSTQSKSITERNSQTNDMKRRPPVVPNMETSSAGINNDLAKSALTEKEEPSTTTVKLQETKEVKLTIQENREAHEGAKHGVEENLPAVVESEAQINNHSSSSLQFQPGHLQKEKQESIGKKDKRESFLSQTKHTNTTTSQPRYKTMLSTSCHQPSTSNNEHTPLHKGIRNDISQLVHNLKVAHPKKRMDEGQITVITLTGDNTGATMQLDSDPSKREGAVHIHRGYKMNPNESAEPTTDGEGSYRERSNITKTMDDQAMEAYVNNNVQSINNSIMFTSSITEKSPGVHLVYSPIQSEDDKPTMETRKAEFNITPSQKLTHEPAIRRRCLRGLFLESSDSDQNNPGKPRRHGCRVRCMVDKEINNI